MDVFGTAPGAEGENLFGEENQRAEPVGIYPASKASERGRLHPACLRYKA